MAVVCEGIGRDYGPQVTALDDVTMTLHPGVTGLVGVNGAGKSTLLRVLAGAQRPSRGSVHLDELDPYGSGRRGFLRRTALMPQSLELPKDARALDAVAYCGWLRSLSARAAKAAAADALDQVGLADRATHKLRSLSGGMQRRVALAQALVAAPDLLLLDEPTTGLDPEQRAGLRQLVSELPRDCVTVVSSHVMEDLESFADTIVVLERGRVIFDGPLETFQCQLGGPERSAEFAFLSLLASHRSAS
jgi:ABC-2 type transport system ATP-binding protein